MSGFSYEPGLSVPFRDREEIARCRAIKRADITNHPNPDFRIRVVRDSDPRMLWLMDIYTRLTERREAGRRIFTGQGP